MDYGAISVLYALNIVPHSESYILILAKGSAGTMFSGYPTLSERPKLQEADVSWFHPVWNYQKETPILNRTPSYLELSVPKKVEPIFVCVEMKP